MACNCGGGRRVITYEARLPGGKIKRYLTESEARAAVARFGGDYAQISRVAK